MKHVLCLVLAATLQFSSAFAAAPGEKNAKETLLYQHELPNVPGKSIKGVLVECGPGSGLLLRRNPEPVLNESIFLGSPDTA